VAYHFSQDDIEVAANNKNIPTLAMVDLFGIGHFHAIEARYICVLGESVIENMRAEGVTCPRENFFITGNPAFDPIFDLPKKIDAERRAQFFPTLTGTQNAVLWIDTPAYWKLDSGYLHTRSDEEILADLDSLAAATKACDAALLVRPHPSQPRAVYDRWLDDTRHNHVYFAGGMPLYPLLQSVDVVATYNSTVSVEALLMDKCVLQLQYHPGKSDMPLAEWGMAWLAETPSVLEARLHDALHNEEEAAQKRAQIHKKLPQEKAAPKIAKHIRDILKM
jgi:CDP-glycerol glycerophosphotransferase (TagB/SpsB family)